MTAQMAERDKYQIHRHLFRVDRLGYPMGKRGKGRSRGAERRNKTEKRDSWLRTFDWRTIESGSGRRELEI